MIWNEIVSLAQVIATVAICATFGVYYYQLRVMKRQLQMMERTSQSNALLSVVEQLSSSEMRQARKTLLQLKKPLSEWTEEEKHAAKKVCVQFDIIEILIKHKVVPSGMIELHWGRTIRDCRKAANQLVDEIRLSIPSAWMEFDNLVARSVVTEQESRRTT